ncbi:hypothetical protein [Mesorhizobium sp. 1M-11]|uniref:hypothetical protein n=1 Tax=Mesorhizobium sp. 1M-11 TaxID=1529006 RepID=UPI0006C76CCE|nr:hypothetical protein [Mesorhizobium sp. 1M-11]
MTRRRVGRVKIDFSVIERFAALEGVRTPMPVFGEDWALSRKSSLHRRKDGSYTLCLIWKSADGFTMSGTYRGRRLEAR